MTEDSINVRELIAEEVRRDQYGRYMVVPPNDTDPIGYTRVTTVAKALDSGGGLADWRATMTVTGMLARPGLRARWEALMVQYEGDPWYGSKDGKSACKKLVEECATVGGANDRKEMGSSLHTITAVVDAGGKPMHLSDETASDLSAYRAGLLKAGVEVLPDYIERMVVLDDWLVAGTFDRIVKVPGYPLPMVGDLKTGADLTYSWPSIAVQQSAYSRADAIYQQGEAKDGTGDTRVSMPEVDQEHGLILWLNAGSGELELYVVDLVAGWQAFMASMWTREWRKRQVAQPLSAPTSAPDLTALLGESIAQARARRGHPSQPPQVPQPPPAARRQGSRPSRPQGDPRATQVPSAQVAAAPLPSRPQPPPGPTTASSGTEPPQVPPGRPGGSHGTPDGTAESDGTPSRTADPEEHLSDVRWWLQERINDIGSVAAARADLTHAWPNGLPTLRASTAHTEAQLALIEHLLDEIEARHGMQFPPSKPMEQRATERVLKLFPGTTEETTTGKEPA